jgi:cell division protein FtsI (penicillin-binding protein 3)/stage V sporulation protein D (sporulation-specific penicillin-binding protein)
MCAIANGGLLMKPQIIHSVVDDQERVVETFKPVEVRRVISSQTAARVREALKAVVSDKGTAALAKVAGFAVAGKTGTAQKPDQKGGYLPDKYVVSFIGFLPADDPEFVGLVMLDEPTAKEDEYYGGVVAAPIFSRIGARAARYLNLEPQPEPPAGSLALSQNNPPRSSKLR